MNKEKINEKISEMIDNMFPEYSLVKSITKLTAITQLICNLLIIKNIITLKELKECLSEDNIQKMEELLEKEALKLRGESDE